MGTHVGQTLSLGTFVYLTKNVCFSGGDISITLIDYNVTKVTYYIYCFISNECQIKNFRWTKIGHIRDESA